MKNKKKVYDPVALKYYYTNFSTLFVKILNIIGLLASLLMLYGLILLCIRNTVYYFLFTPIIIVFLFYYATHYFLNLFYKSFKRQNHQEWIKEYWLKKKDIPLVDIYIPYCGEGISIIKQTCLAVQKIEYENKRIYVLDDSADIDVKNFTEEIGIGYLSRPDKGFMKKAGNIKYAMERTNGEFITIFDADFIPEPDFLKELIPYFSDEKVGLIQSPQFFIEEDTDYKATILSKASAFLQEDFYKIIQTARNNIHAAICVGTNLIYRRSSLINSGGIAMVPYCEDFETGFNITSTGNYIFYLPLILAHGRTPDNPQAYFNQHRRWCYSCIRLLFTKKIFRAPMSFLIRLAYFSNISYYFTEAFSVLTILLFSIMMIVEHHLIDTRYFVYFIPYFLFLFLIQPLNRLRKINLGAFVASALQSFTYLYTLILMIFSRKLDWVPSNLKIKNVSSHFINFMILSAIIISVETYNLFNAIVLKTITFRLWESYPFLVWFIILILTQLFLMAYLIRYLILKIIEK